MKSSDINEYLQEHLGDGFSAKDFRTWAATVLAAVGLADVEEDEVTSDTARRRAVNGVAKQVARHLGNTPAVARSSYIDPRVLDAAEHPRALESVRRAKIRPRRYSSADEQRVIALIERAVSRLQTCIPLRTWRRAL